MFDRVELKNRAKAALKGKYWMCLAATALVSVLSQIMPQISLRFGKIGGRTVSEILQQPELLAAVGTSAAIIILLMLLLNLAFSIFFVSPLLVGRYRFYIKAADNTPNFSEIFHVFKSEHYLNVVKTIFMRDLKLLLWSLCYIIPFFVSLVLCTVNGNAVFLVALSYFGLIPMIMKSYSYFMTDRILAENPEKNWKECISESEAMMKNCRFKTFILQLSFLGWILLGILCCGIGAVFVTPYTEAAITQLYLEKKREINEYAYCYEQL